MISVIKIPHNAPNTARRRMLKHLFCCTHSTLPCGSWGSVPFLCGVCMFSPCLHGFFHRTLASSHSSNTRIWGQVIWLTERWARMVVLYRMLALQWDSVLLPIYTLKKKEMEKRYKTRLTPLQFMPNVIMVWQWENNSLPYYIVIPSVRPSSWPCEPDSDWLSHLKQLHAISISRHAFIERQSFSCHSPCIHQNAPQI